MMALMVSSSERRCRPGSHSPQELSTTQFSLKTHSYAATPTEGSHSVHSSDPLDTTVKEILQNNPEPDDLIHSGIPEGHLFREYHSSCGNRRLPDSITTSATNNATPTDPLMPQYYPLLEYPHHHSQAAAKNRMLGQSKLAWRDLPDVWTSESAEGYPPMGYQNHQTDPWKGKRTSTLYHCHSEEVRRHLGADEPALDHRSEPVLDRCSNV